MSEKDVAITQIADEEKEKISEKQHPLISIIVPVYKVEKYLDQCVESIVNQTYENIEIILVDDGSPDNSPAMCDQWAEKDSRIRVLHKKNGGASAARNAGLDIAQGEYIGFVDSDDYIDNDMYLCMLRELRKTTAKIACCQCVTVPEDGEGDCKLIDLYEVQFLSPEETIEEVFAFRMGTAVWRRLFHKSVFEELRFPEGEINEEFPLIVPFAVKSEGTVYIKKPLYYYRDRADSVTGTLHRSLNALSCVNKNLKLIEAQLSEFGQYNSRNFPYFAAKNSFYMLLSIEKNYKTIDGELNELYKSYFNMAKENKRAFFRSKKTSIKDKILFILLLTGLYKKIAWLWR